MDYSFENMGEKLVYEKWEEIDALEYAEEIKLSDCWTVYVHSEAGTRDLYWTGRDGSEWEYYCTIIDYFKDENGNQQLEFES